MGRLKPRRYWEQLTVEVKKQDKYTLTLVAYADDPQDLLEIKTFQRVAGRAKRKGYGLLKGMSNVYVNGQNVRPYREFYYEK